jgi:hypothetical protein
VRAIGVKADCDDLPVVFGREFDPGIEQRHVRATPRLRPCGELSVAISRL